MFSVISVFTIWARSYENVSYAICEQQRRRSACASVFVVRCLDSMICILAISKVSRFYLASVAEQARLNLTRSKISKDTFSSDVAHMQYENFIVSNSRDFNMKKRLPQSNNFTEFQIHSLSQYLECLNQIHSKTAKSSSNNIRTFSMTVTSTNHYHFFCVLKEYMKPSICQGSANIRMYVLIWTRFCKFLQMSNI